MAYAITTPFENGADAEVRQGDTAAAQAGLPWLILASVAAADRLPQQGTHRGAAPARLSVDGGCARLYFYENVLGASLTEGVLRLALPVHTPLDQVALRDLGALVAAILHRRDEHLSARIEVPLTLQPQRRWPGRWALRAVQTSIQELAQRNRDLASMYTFLAETGYGIDVASLRAPYPEVSWSRFADWAAELQHAAKANESN